MIKFSDGATESHWVRLSETFILVWLEKLFGCFFPLFQDCYQSI